jgi:hypothetical protein
VSPYIPGRQEKIRICGVVNTAVKNESVYTMEIGKCYSSQFLTFSSLLDPIVGIFPACPWRCRSKNYSTGFSWDVLKC